MICPTAPGGRLWRWPSDDITKCPAVACFRARMKKKSDTGCKELKVHFWEIHIGHRQNDKIKSVFLTTCVIYSWLPVLFVYHASTRGQNVKNKASWVSHIKGCLQVLARTTASCIKPSQAPEGAVWSRINWSEPRSLREINLKVLR